MGWRVGWRAAYLEALLLIEPADPVLYHSAGIFVFLLRAMADGKGDIELATQATGDHTPPEFAGAQETISGTPIDSDEKHAQQHNGGVLEVSTASMAHHLLPQTH